MATKKPASETTPLPSEPGRWGSAWSVLRGQRLVPVQIQAEWLTYRQIFDDVLTRLGAQLARQAKAHNESLRAQLELGVLDQETQAKGSLSDRKDALRQRFAQSRGLHVLRPQNAAQPAAPEEAP